VKEEDFIPLLFGVELYDGIGDETLEELLSGLVRVCVVPQEGNIDVLLVVSLPAHILVPLLADSMYSSGER
jgi:hypothetical protein